MIGKHDEIIAPVAGLFASVVDQDGEIFASIPLRQGVTKGRELLPYLVEGATLSLPSEVTHLVPPHRLRIIVPDNFADTAAQPFQARPISDLERRMNERLRASEALLSRMHSEMRAREASAGEAPVHVTEPPAPAPEENDVDTPE